MGRFSSLIAANSSQKQLFVTSAGVWYARSKHRGKSTKHRGKSTMSDALQLLRSRRSTKPVELVGPARNYPQATAKQVEAEHRRLARAPLVIAVVSRAGAHVKIPEWEQVLSAGAAAMSLVLAAHALGYGANWITEWYAYDRRVLDALGLAPNERIAGFVHIGRQSEVPADRPRPPISEIAIRFGMDN
jgi:nitroreductase